MPLSSLQHRLGEHLLAQGQRLVKLGCVSGTRVLQDGTVVTGIAASEPESTAPSETFRVYVRLGAGQLSGECTCEAPQPCVHVAAVLVSAANTAQPANNEAARGKLSHRHAAGAPPPAQPAQRQQLCYLLKPAATPWGGIEHPGRCELSIWVRQNTPVATGGAPDSTHLFVPRALMSGESGGRDRTEAFPRYVDSLDREILKSLLTLQIDGPWPLSGDCGAELMRRVAGTGRANWGSFDGARLRTGETRNLTFAWEILTDGAQHIRCETAEGAPTTLLPDLDPPLYVDPLHGLCGEARLPCPPDLIRQFWNRAPIPPEDVPTVNALITRAAPAEGLPLLRELSVRTKRLTSLTGKLVLSAKSATLQFVYNDIAIDSSHLQPGDLGVRRFDGDVLYEFERDCEEEMRLRTRLATELAGSSGDVAIEDLTREAWLSFMTKGVPALRSEGWAVDVDNRFPYRIAEPESWYGDLRPQKEREREWFDLRLGVTVEGHAVNLLPALVSYLQATLGSDTSNHPIADPAYCRTGELLFIHLEDGGYVPVDLARVERIGNTLVELFDRDGLDTEHALQLPMHQASRVAQLATGDHGERSIVLRSDDSHLLAHIEGVSEFARIRPISPPVHFRTALRPYQREGLGWLQFLRALHAGGILADDMGLGKTVQTLAHLALEKHEGRLRKPCLIVAPVSVIGNWQQELRTLAPELSVLTLHGARRKELFARIATTDVVITGYPLLHLDSETFLAHDFYMVILDEAQTIKNPRARVSQAACALRAEHRLCLTGTPMENHLGELWSLFEFLQPGLLGDERSFQRQYATPIEKSGDTKRFHALTGRIAPFVLRRTKDAVAKELPPKTQIVESILLDQAQRDFYDGIRLAMHRRVREVIEQQGLARSQITVLDALLKLRQACCDPRLVRTVDGAGIDSGASTVPSAKMEWLTTMLPELVAEGRRILLFSQFTSMLGLIESAVRELDIPYCLLTGETQNRAALVQTFQSGLVPIFLISLKAGGTGLNLTAADTVIHYDPWWNPAVEAQATDRAHRIGQDKPVFVYKLIAQGTVEEKIMKLQADKHALASQLYAQHGALPTQFDAADVEGLFCA